MKNPTELRIIFMGTSFFAEKILVALKKNNYNIISVYTQPDKRVGREQKVKKSLVKITAEKFKLKIFEPVKFNENNILELRVQKPDLIIVAAYGKILPKTVLRIPEFGSINIHASLLPKFRGPSPIQNAILNGEKETGTTIMLMDENIDTGDILSQKKINIVQDEKFPELLEKIAKISASLLLETLPLWVNKKIVSQKQNENEATHCQLIEKLDGRIIWSDTAESIYNRFRALYFWPGIFSYWEKNKQNIRIKFHKIKIITEENENFKNFSMGEIFNLDGEIAVKTGMGAIILEEVQIEGKTKIGINNFINGYPKFVGSVLK